MWSGGDDFNDEGEQVRLYQPIQYGPKPSFANMRCSFIGGETEAGDTPTCSSCNDPLHLIVQLFLPASTKTEDTPATADKTLQVFCCNRAACIHQLFRNGGDKFCYGGKGAVICRRVVPSSLCETKAQASSTPQPPRTTSNGETDDWNMDGVDDGDLADLEDRLASIETSKSKPAAKPKTSAASNAKSSRSTFPSFMLSSLREPVAERSEGMDEDDVGISRDSDDKIQQMLARYMAEEDDPEILAALRGSQGDGGTGGGGRGGERDQRLSAQDRALLTYSDRLKRCPRQVVRHALGGVPMWSIPKPQPASRKKDSAKPNHTPTVPPCSCGMERIFEAQVLPSLLHVLEVDKWAASSQQDNPSSSLTTALGRAYEQGGMNWGNLAIYSCPKACTNSQEEFVVVQASIDEEPSEPKRAYQEEACAVVGEEEDIGQDDEDANDEEEFFDKR